MPIANIKKGNDAYDCLHYVLEKEQAQLIETNCVGDDPRVIANEFEATVQNHLGNGAKKHTTLKVHHCSIGLPIGVELDHFALREIAYTYLEGMGFSRVNNQYLIAQHHDSKHPHIHIVANRIGVDGKTVSDAWERRKAEAIMRQIEVDYNLPVNQSSREVEVKAPKVGEVRRARDRGEPIPRVWMQQQIQEIAPQCLSLVQFKEKLAAVGIELEVVPLKSKRKGKRKLEAEPTPEERTEGEVGEVAPLPPEQWDREAVGLVYRLDTPPWKHEHPLGEANKLTTAHPPEEREVAGQQPEGQQPEGQQPSPQKGGKGKGQKTSSRQSRRPVKPVSEAVAGPFAVFSASRLGKRFTQQGLKQQFGLGLPLAERLEQEVRKSVRRLFDPEKWLAGEFGTELMAALPGAEPPIEVVNTPTERGTAPDETTPPAAPKSLDLPTAVQQEVEGQKRLEAKRYYTDRWLEMSGEIKAAIPHILPERLPVAVAAIAIKKWDIPTAAAILSQSEAGKEQQELGKVAFREWLRLQLEAAVTATQQQANQTQTTPPKRTDTGR